MTKHTLYHSKKQPWWLSFLLKYRYQLLGLVLLAVLLVVIGGSHNPAELEGTGFLRG